MEQQSVRKTYKYKLISAPTQEQELGRVLDLCRRLYNTALEQRNVAYQRRHFSVARYQQEAELKAIRAAFPEYAAVHSHVLQDVLARLDKAFHGFFRRIRASTGATAPLPSPTKSTAMALASTLGSSPSPRLGVLPCAGHVR